MRRIAWRAGSWYICYKLLILPNVVNIMTNLKKVSSRRKNGQTAVEYMLLLGAVTAVILVSFQTILPQAQTATEGFYNTTVNLILGDPPPVNPNFNRYP